MNIIYFGWILSSVCGIQINLSFLRALVWKPRQFSSHWRLSFKITNIHSTNEFRFWAHLIFKLPLNPLSHTPMFLFNKLIRHFWWLSIHRKPFFIIHSLYVIIFRAKIALCVFMCPATETITSLIDGYHSFTWISI